MHPFCSPSLTKSDDDCQVATFKGGLDLGSNVVVAGNLITGQNPASSKATADAVIAALK